MTLVKVQSCGAFFTDWKIKDKVIHGLQFLKNEIFSPLKLASNWTLTSMLLLAALYTDA